MKITRLFDLLQFQLESFPQQDALCCKIEREWKKYSTKEVIQISNRVSLALLKSGIKKDDKIAIISQNRPEWNFIDYGAQQIGAVIVPIYPTITVEDFKFIFNDAEVKMVFVADYDLYTKANEAAKNINSIIGIFSFNEISDIPHWTSLTKAINEDDTTLLESHRANVEKDDLVTLIYTSGTTGTPKGVMLSHNNILSNVLALKPLMPVNEKHRALSFLPLSHIYERMMHYLYTYCGISIYYAESLDTISDNLKEVHPHIFVTVPRLLEKVYDKIYAKGADLTGIKKSLFFWALNLGLEYDISRNQGWWYNFQLKLANKLIFKKWREALGGEIRAVVSGGAALQPRLAKVFWAAQIKILEGYGLTETSPVICVNRANKEENRIGTVGPVISGIEMKIAEDGEILTKGPHVMKGYFKRPDLTEQVVDREGWLHTGDIGTLVEGKFLKITDRKKEMFKTSGGKYIAPQMLENKFKESRVIEQIMVIGDGQKFPAALIVPSFIGLKAWCEIKGIPYSTDEEMINQQEVKEKFLKEITQLNQSFAQYERVKKFEILPRPWTIESGEMTPTLKLKRKNICSNNQALIEKLYSDVEK